MLRPLAAAIALAAAGCASDDGGRAATQPDATTGARLTLSLHDHGRTVAVTRRTRITLVLGGRYRWRDPTWTGARLDVDAVISDAPTGAQTWEIHALSTGRARLTTRGSPACRPTTPGCPARPRRYSVTLVVRR